METMKLSVPEITDTMAPALRRLYELRCLDAEEWINEYASGTLRKNKRIGFKWRKQYIHERVAYEFGYSFECLESSRVTWGEPISEGDCHPVTESGWHIERCISMRRFEEDRFGAAYITASYPTGETKEGIGIVLRVTSCPWIPAGYTVFAIIAEVDKVKHDYKPAVNPL